MFLFVFLLKSWSFAEKFPHHTFIHAEIILKKTSFAEGYIHHKITVHF